MLAWARQQLPSSQSPPLLQPETKTQPFFVEKGVGMWGNILCGVCILLIFWSLCWRRRKSACRFHQQAAEAVIQTWPRQSQLEEGTIDYEFSHLIANYAKSPWTTPPRVAPSGPQLHPEDASDGDCSEIDILDTIESFEANTFQNRCLEAYMRRRQIPHVILHGQPTFVYGMYRNEAVQDEVAPPGAARTAEEWAQMLHDQQRLRDMVRSPRRRSRSHSLRPRPTAQSDRVDRYNERLGIQIHPEWQTHWRRRNRRSPPRNIHDMQVNLERWRTGEAHVLHIRILENPVSRYVYLSLAHGREFRPMDLERLIRGQPPRAQRYLFVDHEGYVCHHDRPIPLERLMGITAVPGFAVGATLTSEESQYQLAFQAVRSSLPRLLNAKVVRTLFRSQPQLIKRIAACTDDTNRMRILMVSAAQRAGIGNLVADADMVGITPKKGQMQAVPDSPAKNTQHASSARRSSPPAPAMTTTVAAAAPPMKTVSLEEREPEPSSRWARRQKEGGWQTIPKRASEPPVLTLEDEWDAPVLSELRLGQAGIAYVRDQAELFRQALAMRGNTFKTSLLCPIRAEPPKGVLWRMSRTVFHATSPYQRHGQEQVHRASKVAFLYQLHASESVSLRTRIQTTSSGLTVSTVVLKLVAHKRYTPPLTWAALEQGRNKPFSEQLQKDLSESSLPAGSVQDLFQMQQTSRLITTLVRVKAESAETILGTSGKSWIFSQPLGALAERYPITWISGPLPSDLTVTRKRCSDSGALGLSLSDRRIGYRTRLSDLTEVKKKLGHSDTRAWRLSGAPLAASTSEAENWLREMSLDGVILSHTRRIRRNCQDWIVRAEASQAPKIDALALTFDSKEYLITLARLMPRSGPPVGAKQWKGPNRWNSRTPPSESTTSEPALATKVTLEKEEPGKPMAPVVSAPPSVPKIAPANEIESLSSMVKIMYEAMISSGLLKSSTSAMETETFGVKRPAEAQLSKEAAE